VSKLKKKIDFIFKKYFTAISSQKCPQSVFIALILLHPIYIFQMAIIHINIGIYAISVLR
jgi:hypothetical protein